MCDCHARLLNEAKDYIKFKISQLQLRNYIRTYQDLEELQTEIRNLTANLKLQQQSICANFTINDALDKQINERYEHATQKYQTVEVLNDDICK